MHNRISRPLLAGWLALAGGGALAVPAGEDGLSLGAQLGLIRDDNPRLVPRGLDDLGLNRPDSELTPQADTIYYTQLQASYSGSFSLQKLGVSVQAKDVNYDRLSELDYRSYNNQAWWNWTLTDRLTGRLAYTSDRTPVSLKYETGRQLDLISRQAPEATLAWALTPDWYIDARYVPSSSEHSLESKKYLDNDATEYRYRLGTRSPTGYGGGLLLRDNRLDYVNPDARPPGSALDSGYRDRETSVYASWGAGGRTRVDGKLGYLSREHERNTERDYKGGIGNLNLNYSLTGDTDLKLDLARQLGGEEESANGNYAVHRIAGLGVVYRLTPLISTQLGWRSEIIDFQNGFANNALDQTQRVDRERVFSVSASYKPHPLVDVGLSWQQDRRTSNIQFGDFKQQQVSLYLLLSY